MRCLSACPVSSVAGEGALRRDLGQCPGWAWGLHQAAPVAEAPSQHHIHTMPPENLLTAPERAELVRLLRATIATDPYLLSPRIGRLKGAPAKLSGEAPEPVVAVERRASSKSAATSKTK